MSVKRNYIYSTEINTSLVKITPKLLLVLLFLILILPGISLLAGFNLGFNSHLHSIDYFYVFFYRWAITVLTSLIVILAMVDFWVNRQEVVFTIGLAYLFLAYFNTLFIIYHDWVYASSKNLENLHEFVWFVSNALTAVILCFGLTLLLFKMTFKAKIYYQIVFFIAILLLTTGTLHQVHLCGYRLEGIIDNSRVISKILTVINLGFYLYLILLQNKLKKTSYLANVNIFLYLGVIQCAMSFYILFDLLKHFDASLLGSSFLQLLCYFLILTTLITRYFYSYILMLNNQKIIVEDKYKFEQLSNQDPLTHLLNRRAFEIAVEDSLVEAQKIASSLVILFLDVNNFKKINDTMGHQVGDQLLQQIAIRIKSALTTRAIIARLGGDEFAAVILSLDINDLATYFNALSMALEAPYMIEGHTVTSSVSIGYALYPQDGNTIQSLLKKADSAMYKRKRAKRTTE